MAAVTAEILEADPFAQAKLERPGCKFVRFIDRTLGVEFIAAIAPGTAWFELFPETQTVEIDRSQTIAELVDRTARRPDHVTA
jgi:hypothetical protein